MATCVVGAMRSGTSMITNLLRISGLYLGADADLLPPAPDNPDGFWENARFVALNDTILNEYGGAWDCPPVFPDGWEHADQLREAHARAAELLAEFVGQAHWGWKDPRTSLTMAFWQQHCPEMKIVLCVRNPLEVARSLHRRQGFSPQLSMNLWYRYTTGVLERVPREHVIITHYESYFRDADAELRRVLRALGMPHSDATIAESCAAISGTLRHHQFTNEQLHAAGVAPLVRDLYNDLVGSAASAEPRGDRSIPRSGPATHGDAGATARALSPQQPTDNATHHVGKLDVETLDTMVMRDELTAVQQRLAESIMGAERLFADLVGQGEYVRELEGKLAAMDESVRTQGGYIQTLEADLREAYEKMRGQGEYVRTLEANLTQAGKEIEAQGEYVRTMEADVRDAYERMRAQGEYIRTLEADLRDARSAGARSGVDAAPA
jgi:hypothetical protein